MQSRTRHGLWEPLVPKQEFGNEKAARLISSERSYFSSPRFKIGGRGGATRWPPSPPPDLSTPPFCGGTVRFSSELGFSLPSTDSSLCTSFMFQLPNSILPARRSTVRCVNCCCWPLLPSSLKYFNLPVSFSMLSVATKFMGIF